MDVEFFGQLYVAVLVAGTGAVQAVGIVLAIKAWLETRPQAPELGVRESLLLSNDDNNTEVNGGDHGAGRACEV